MKIQARNSSSDALMSEAKKKGLAVISMKDDWKTIFPPTGFKQ